MCYILFGNINEEAFDDTFLRICRKHGFVQREEKLRQRDIRFKSDIKGGAYFYITSGYCDCRTPIGCGNPDHKDMRDFVNWIQGLKACRHMKAMYIIKHWISEKKGYELKPAVFLHADEADAAFLAGMEEERPYRIEYFKRYQ